MSDLSFTEPSVKDIHKCFKRLIKRDGDGTSDFYCKRCRTEFNVIARDRRAVVIQCQTCKVTLTIEDDPKEYKRLTQHILIKDYVYRLIKDNSTGCYKTNSATDAMQAGEEVVHLKDL